jgi:hypothetical protein
VDRGHNPATVCNAQGDPTNGWLVDVMGADFSPLPAGVLTDQPEVIMPSAALTGASTLQIPESRVSYVDSTRIVLAFPTRDTTGAGATEAPGTYSLTITNPNGNSGALSNALTVVPPPTVASVKVLDSGANPLDPNVCSNAPQTLVITGTGFRTDEPPTVAFVGGAGSINAPPVATPLSATQIKVQLPSGFFTAAQTSSTGTAYTVRVTNPDGCEAPHYASDPGGFGVTDIKVFTNCHRLGTLSVSPRSGWEFKNQPITITNAFSVPTSVGFSGGSPQVFIDAPVKGMAGVQHIPLRRVAYVDPNTITAVVPDCSGLAATPTSGDPSVPGCTAGIVAGGPYNLSVVDPSGANGSIAAAFWVTHDQPPTILAINPSTATTTGLSGSSFLAVSGTHFFNSSGTGAHSPTVLIGTQVTGGVEFCPLPLHTGGVVSDTEVDVDAPASVGGNCYAEDPVGNRTASSTAITLKPGLYVIRLQHGADVSFADFSGLIITQASVNPLTGPEIPTKLAEPLYNFPLVQTSDDLGNNYLLALGGQNATGPTASVELARLNLFGDVVGTCDATGANCTFRKLDRATSGGNLNPHQGQVGVRVSGGVITSPTPRNGATAVVRQAAEPCPGSSTNCTTSYVFLISGFESGAPVNKVERAQVLRVADAPVISDAVSTNATGTVAAGTYYYKVAAVQQLTDAKNPGGETLPSDELPVTMAATGSATISWSCTATSASFKIYRSPSPTTSSGSERLLATVAQACSGGAQSYTDSGARTPAASDDPPLRPGSLGNWVSQAALGTARGDARAVIIGNNIYVAGGSTNCQTFSTGCTPTDTASVETIAFSSSTSADLTGSWASAGTTMLNARSQHSLLAMTPADNPELSATDILIAVGGTKNGVPISGITEDFIEMSTLSGTSTGPWSKPAQTPDSALSVGGWAETQANQVFVEGTHPQTGLFDRATSQGICGDPTCTLPAPTFQLNAGVPAYATGSPRYLVGETLFRAFIYTAGGANQASATPTTPGTTLTDTLERLIY